MLYARVCQHCMSAQGDVKNRGWKIPALTMLGYNYFLFAEYRLKSAKNFVGDCFCKYIKTK